LNSERERVRSLEQQESGEMRRLLCPACGRSFFSSVEEFRRHQPACLDAQARRAAQAKTA
jgi:hypothetical protein